ncbi:glycosyltransferase family 4 protein [Streptomyces sp. B1I3]|uniref:glycosyltransferase family 4 protein n=1 Tax=Streptomyces sp. B1I3 TaxID=3042264 RepID=UPI0027888F1E|nr:glycosyltransferase family 4 protein [Streptomyces sp. B1I3]MDQ0797163.1 glycosyltransferase involved in cell wall biosynthesis [Streptomyces sp. B1I3]
MSELRTVQVLGGGAGSSAHVTALAAGLVARGVQVTVCAPPGADRAHGFPATGARFAPVPRRSDPAAVAALRAACVDADVVHAHGLHAAVRAGIALSGRSTPLVVTWHTRTPVAGARGRLLHLLERRAARAASVVLGTSTELVDRARRRGAKDARLARTAVPASHSASADPAEAGGDVTGRDGAAGEATADGRPRRDDGKVRAELGAVGSPLLVSVAGPAPHHGYDTLLDAARVWRAHDPVPLLVVVGEEHRTAALGREAAEEGLPVVLAGRDRLGEILAAADLAVLPGRGEHRPVLGREALRLGVPLVAAESGGLSELVGEAAVRVPYGDAEALARTVTELLDDAGRRERLARAGLLQAVGWPTEDDTVAHVLSVYDELAQPLATLRT